MGRQELNLEATFDAEPVDVWKVLSDPSTYKDWMAGFKSATAKGLKKGSRFRLVTAVGKSTLESDVEVTRCDPAEALVWEHHEDLLDGKPFEMAKDTRSEFLLSGKGGKTHLKVRFSFEPHGLKARLGAGLFLNASVKPEMERSLERLRKLVE